MSQAARSGREQAGGWLSAVCGSAAGRPVPGGAGASARNLAGAAVCGPALRLPRSRRPTGGPEAMAPRVPNR